MMTYQIRNLIHNEYLKEVTHGWLKSIWYTKFCLIKQKKSFEISPQIEHDSELKWKSYLKWYLLHNVCNALYTWFGHVFGMELLSQFLSQVQVQFFKLPSK